MRPKASYCQLFIFFFFFLKFPSQINNWIFFFFFRRHFVGLYFRAFLFLNWKILEKKSKKKKRWIVRRLKSGFKIAIKTRNNKHQMRKKEIKFVVWCEKKATKKKYLKKNKNTSSVLCVFFFSFFLTFEHLNDTKESCLSL